MKYDRIMWGVILLFIGAVILLDNFNVIDFYWWHIWKFWPVALITIGLSMLLNKNGSQLGSQISLGVLVVALVVFFVKGQDNPSRSKWVKGWDKEDFEKEFDIDDRKATFQKFQENYADGDSAKLTTLNLNGGGSSYKLDESTDDLFVAEVKRTFASYGLTRMSTDSTTELSFKMSEAKKNKWNLNGGGNSVKLMLSDKPVWKLNLDMGASEADFDLQNFKVREVNFNGGAAELDIKVGNLLPITDINVKSGIADVNIEVPETSGCQIKTKTGLSSKDFPGFNKVKDNLYESSNFKTATQKVFVNLDGGLSSFEVKRY